MIALPTEEWLLIGVCALVSLDISRQQSSYAMSAPGLEARSYKARGRIPGGVPIEQTFSGTSRIGTSSPSASCRMIWRHLEYRTGPCRGRWRCHMGLVVVAEGGGEEESSSMGGKSAEMQCGEIVQRLQAAAANTNPRIPCRRSHG